MCRQLVVGQRLDLGFERVDRAATTDESSSDLLALARTKDLREHAHDGPFYAEGLHLPARVPAAGRGRARHGSHSAPGRPPGGQPATTGMRARRLGAGPDEAGPTCSPTRWCGPAAVDPHAREGARGEHRASARARKCTSLPWRVRPTRAPPGPSSTALRRAPPRSARSGRGAERAPSARSTTFSRAKRSAITSGGTNPRSSAGGQRAGPRGEDEGEGAVVARPRRRLRASLEVLARSRPGSRR